jgi:hypothetical protein
MSVLFRSAQHMPDPAPQSEGISTVDLLGPPPSMRTANELWAKADELRRLAQTARIVDTDRALIVLAGRFEAMALRRSIKTFVGGDQSSNGRVESS